jgi:hypothetical protein
MIRKVNSNGHHQFHQYQQNEQAPITITELTEHKYTPRHMTLKIQVLARNRHKNVTGLNLLMGFQPSSLDNWT